MADELWCVHVLGPDSLIAMPDLETADRRAVEWNSMFGKIAAERGHNPFDPKCSAVVEKWTGSAKTHAEEIERHGGNPDDIT